MTKKVLVSGCYDLLHPGHVAFFEEAARFGELHVSVGSDRNVTHLKGRPPLFTEDERVYLVGRIGCVKKAFVASGSGMLDFEPDLARVRPDVFVVNEDGHTEDKAELCRRHGIDYQVLQRIPAQDFPARSSTDAKARLALPAGLVLAGGGMDRPQLSSRRPGSVVVVSLEPSSTWATRSELATSTRVAARELWGDLLPAGNPERLARILFAFANPPGTEPAGSAEAIGLVIPGVTRLDYAGGHWPEQIESRCDPETVHWLSSRLFLAPSAASHAVREPDRGDLAALSTAGAKCWDAIQNRDVERFGRAIAGDGLVMVSAEPLEGATPIHVRGAVLQ